MGTTADIIIKLVLIVIIFAISLVVAMYSTYAERKIAAFFQDRVGPNRAGPWGILQPLADGGKMFLKEEIIPTNATPFLFIVGPSLAILTACIGSAVIPWGKTWSSAEKLSPCRLQILMWASCTYSAWYRWGYMA